MSDWSSCSSTQCGVAGVQTRTKICNPPKTVFDGVKRMKGNFYMVEGFGGIALDTDFMSEPDKPKHDYGWLVVDGDTGHPIILPDGNYMKVTAILDGSHVQIEPPFQGRYNNCTALKPVGIFSTTTGSDLLQNGSNTSTMRVGGFVYVNDTLKPFGVFKKFKVDAILDDKTVRLEMSASEKSNLKSNSYNEVWYINDQDLNSQMYKCSGVETETKSCITPCPVDGYLTNWTIEGICQAEGQKYVRFCVPPQNGGKPCPVDELVKYESCQSNAPQLAMNQYDTTQYATHQSIPPQNIPQYDNSQYATAQDLPKVTKPSNTKKIIIFVLILIFVIVSAIVSIVVLQRREATRATYPTNAINPMYSANAINPMYSANAMNPMITP
jgi:hypothetical protein